MRTKHRRTKQRKTKNNRTRTIYGGRGKPYSKDGRARFTPGVFSKLGATFK